MLVSLTSYFFQYGWGAQFFINTFSSYKAFVKVCFRGQAKDATYVSLASEDHSSRGYKTFFMLNSVEYEILNAHKYKNYMKFGFFLGGGVR